MFALLSTSSTPRVLIILLSAKLFFTLLAFFFVLTKKACALLLAICWFDVHFIKISALHAHLLNTNMYTNNKNRVPNHTVSHRRFGCGGFTAAGGGGCGGEE